MARVRVDVPKPNAALDPFKSVLFATCGVALLIGAGSIVRSELSFLDRTIVTSGVVTKEEAGPTHVLVRFTTRAGRPVTYFQGGEIFQRVGDHVFVRYDPTDPTIAPSLDTFGATWGASLTIGGLGAVFTLVGFSTIFAGVRDARMNDRSSPYT